MCLHVLHVSVCAGRAREIRGGGEEKPARRRGKLNLSRTAGGAGGLPERNIAGTRYESYGDDGRGGREGEEVVRPQVPEDGGCSLRKLL